MGYLLDLEALDVVKALLEVGLDCVGVAGLAQDLQEVVVGKEVETGEDVALGLQVHIEGLLDLFQGTVHFHQLLQEACKERRRSQGACPPSRVTPPFAVHLVVGGR